jgi:hypothetical protein
VSGDESILRRVAAPGLYGGTARRLMELDRDEALGLLASVPMGRVVFTLGALPAIRPVNHLVHESEVVIRTRLSAKLSVAAAAPRGTVVAYQADELDFVNRLGWSVVVTGLARPVTDPAIVARCERLLVPWVDTAADSMIGIQAEIVTGFRLVESDRRHADDTFDQAPRR